VKNVTILISYRSTFFGWRETISGQQAQTENKVPELLPIIFDKAWLD
jgi:hypothetical protein